MGTWGQFCRKKSIRPKRFLISLVEYVFFLVNAVDARLFGDATKSNTKTSIGRQSKPRGGFQWFSMVFKKRGAGGHVRKPKLEARTRTQSEAAAINSSGYWRGKFLLLTGWCQSVMRLGSSATVFNLDSLEDYNSLIDMLWAADYSEHMTRMQAANPELLVLLDGLTQNTYTARNWDNASVQDNRRHRFEGVFSALYRAQSQKSMTLLAALIGITCVALHVHKMMVGAICYFFRGVMPSVNWVLDLTDAALERDPGSRYEAMPGVGSFVFDNLTMQVSYTGRATMDSYGYRQDMTTWQTLTVPRAACPDFDPSFIKSGHGPAHLFMCSILILCCALLLRSCEPVPGIVHHRRVLRPFQI